MVAYPDINPILLQIGAFSIKWYGLMYIIGIISGYLLVKKDLIEKLHFNTDQILNNATYIMLGIIVGGRIGYILIYDLAFYLKNPLEWVAVWHGGMSYHGGAIGCVIALWIYSKRNQKKLWALLDLLGFASTIGIGLGRIGNFINGELFGRVTTVPWGMVFPRGGVLPRHPSQLYEAFCEGFLLFLILFFTKKKIPLKEGQLFGVYIASYGILRFGLEFFREPDAQIGLLWHYFSMGQVWCFVMIVIGGTICWIKK